MAIISAMIKNNNHHQTICLKLITCLFSLRFSLYILSLAVTIFIHFEIYLLHKSQPTLVPPSRLSQQVTRTETLHLIQKLRLSVTFLPLKDLRFADEPLVGHTWFMSGLYDTHQEGEVQYQEFPSESSKGKLLCLEGHNRHDGSWNYYALAWPEAVPSNASLMEGLTFISYNHYDYDNMWHGLSAIVPFVAWSLRNHCERPERWVLYHWGENRLKMGAWLSKLTSATFGKDPEIEGFDDFSNDKPVCFEKAVVMRHNEGGMSRDRRTEVYDLMRCRARTYCNVSVEMIEALKLTIGLTLLMRTGPRSFKNETAVIRVFKQECGKVEGCRLMVAHPDNLTFCEQVSLMSKTDIVASPHGAQLSNMFLMDRNSSAMEFFPKGWLRLAGVGQFVFRWLASWSGMIHEGEWRDPLGENSCPYPDKDRRCMSVFKNGRIGLNETYVGEWVRSVLNEVKTRKLEDVKHNKDLSGCAC